MAIFNSLGSNYDFQYVTKSMFSDTAGQRTKLKNLLEAKYQGKAILTYKGREAITLALLAANLPKGSLVAINGFTCFAVYRAVEIAGYTPVCLDLEEQNSDLNFSADKLEIALKGNANIKAVIIQNTFGYSADIQKIKKIAGEKNIVIIEDLAHCVGTKYESKEEAGTVGDFTTLSFSQDKIIDGVSGGALVIRNKKHLSRDQLQFKRQKNQIKDRIYPFLTYIIRSSYNSGFGKVLHYILRDLNLLSKPMEGGLYNLYPLSDWHSNLALIEFGKFNQQLKHRKEIARIYAKKINKKILNQNIINKIGTSSNLRFPIFTENREELVKFLKKQKIFVSDIWYKDVAHECSNATTISNVILNLPTHINVSKEDALKIAERINAWLKLQ